MNSGCPFDPFNRLWLPDDHCIQRAHIDLDRFLVLRRGLKAKGAKRANVAKRLKIRVVRLIRVIRVERLLVLEKAMPMLIPVLLRIS